MNEGAEILIVDDLPEHIAFAGSLLKQEGYQVYAVTSGQAALKFLEQKQPDLIVLDIKMAGMNGLEVCRIVKEREDTRDIPILFLTSEASPQIIKQGFELGCCDYVTKPFVREEYLARIKTHLRVSRQNRELAAAYSELNLFCSAVSHDLRAPLQVIQLLIQTLQDELGGDVTEEVTKITGMIHDKSDQLITMLERLLEFSRMCNIKPKFEPLDLNAMLDSIFLELKSLEPNRSITMTMEPIPLVQGDAVLVRMALKNVLSNAFKFTRHRQHAKIVVHSFEEDGFTVVAIRDNGAGFDMAYADKLFAVFQRLHEPEEFEGSGVGLALVDRVMKRHGGKVRMVGEEDKGAELFLYFQQ